MRATARRRVPLPGLAVLSAAAALVLPPAGPLLRGPASAPGGLAAQEPAPATVEAEAVLDPAATGRPEDAGTAEFEPAAARGEAFPLTIRSVMRGPEVVGRSPTGVRWTDDGRWVYFRWLPAGRAWYEDRELYRVPAAGGLPERLEEEAADSLRVLFAEGDVSPDGSRRVSAVEGDLYLVDRATLEVRRLTETTEAERSPSFSADGHRIFFRRGDDLFSRDLRDGSLRQLTDIREGPEPEEEEEEREGQRGFLAEQQEELFETIRIRKRQEEEREAREEREKERRPEPLHLAEGESVSTLEPDPTGTAVLLGVARRPEGTRRTRIPEWVTESGFTEEDEVRPKVGDAREGLRAGLLRVETGRVEWLDLAPERTAPDPGAGPEDEGDAEAGADAAEADTAGAAGGDRGRSGLAVLRVLGWNEAGSHALILTVPDDWKSWHLYALEREGGALTEIASLSDTAWVDGPCFGCAGWIPDDAPVSGDGPRAWYVSEETGWARLYAVDADGTDRVALTDGEWEVRDVEIPEGRDRFLLHTSEVSPFDEHPWWMAFDGSDRVQVLRGEGEFEATPSPDGSRLAVVRSRSNRPPELFLAPARPGLEPAALERVTTSPTTEWLAFPWVDPEIVRFEAEDGARVPARVYRPGDLGAEANGAGVVFVHGAGYLHNVHRGWSSYYREYMFHHLLAAAGYTVLDIDYRGSAGYGREWRTAVYRFMGGRDLGDQVDGARWLVEHEGVDPDRIGIYGGSYGGFLTLMALFTAGDAFRAGAALRSVTDWAHYNHWYTRRILNLPHEDREAYRRSSPIYHAEGLGPDQHLLVLHGMEDRNVHFQDVVRLAQRLIELGKENWELAVYPVEDHSFTEPASWTDEYRRIFELFQGTVGAYRSPPTAGAGGR